MADIIVRAFLDQVLANLSGGSFSQPQEIHNFMIGWAQQEGGGITNGAKYNPLNCGYPEPGSTQFNNSGVQIYKAPIDGINATVSNLQEEPYSALMHALTTGDLINLGFTTRGAPSLSNMMSANVARGLTMWVSGTTDIVVHQDYILAVMHNAGISNPTIEGGNRQGSQAGQSQSDIDAYGNKSLGQDTSGITTGGVVQNAVNNVTNPLGNIFSGWTQNDFLKVIGGAFLIIIAAALFMRLQFPQSPIAQKLSFLPGKK